jgi:GNAT superfamily N-acetyltransferase
MRDDRRSEPAGTPGSKAPERTAPNAATALGTTHGRLSVRRFLTGDDVGAITALLHRAYRPQVEMGLAPLAGRQSDAVTLDRVLNSECYLAFDRGESVDEGDNDTGGRLVGVILLNEHERVKFPPHFLRDDVAHFAMFAVDPSCQGAGVGRALLDVCAQRAMELGAQHLALSMAEPDTKLRAYYEKQGFSLVQYWQWPYTNYRSVILSRELP